MRNRLALALVGVLGCTSSGPSSVDKTGPVTPATPRVAPETAPAPTPEPTPEPTPTPKPDPEVASAAITVQMTAATLADDCGGGPNTPPQAPPVKAAAQRERRDGAPGKSRSRAKRRCEQSSIQLAIVAPQGAEPAAVAVKSVEVFLESGEAIGTLEARAPSVWSDAEGYMPWDQKIAPAQDLSVSYAVSQPDWSKVDDRWDQTYTVKAVVSIAGEDRALEQQVEVDAPTSLPPNVRT